MNSILLSANVMAPLLIMMVIGYWLRKCGRLNQETVIKMNGITFHVFISSMMFDSIYNAEEMSTDYLSFVTYGVVCATLLFIISWLYVSKYESLVTRKGVMIQGLYRSNFALLGLAISKAFFGEGNIGAAVVMIAVVVPIYNFFAVIALSAYENEKVRVLNTIKAVLKNPIIVAAALGFGLRYLDIQLPQMALSVVYYLSNMATPLALILLGGFFQFCDAKKNIKSIALISLLKLIIIPLIFIPISIAFGFRGVELATLMIMFAAPVGISTFTMSQEMGGDSELACHLILFTSLFSMFTIFLWIAILHGLSLI